MTRIYTYKCLKFCVISRFDFIICMLAWLQYSYRTVQYSLQTVRPRRYSENLNVSVLCPLPPNFGLSRYQHPITLTDKTPKTGKISTKMCRSIHHTGLPIMLDRGSLALTQYGLFFYSGRDMLKKDLYYTIAIVLQTTTRIGKKESAFDKIILPPK